MIKVQLEPDGPITDMDENLLDRLDGHYEDERESTSWVEYKLGERIVHRSVHVTIKQGLDLAPQQGNFGG